MADKTPKGNELAIYLKSAIYPSQCNFEKKNRLHFKTGARLRRGPGNNIIFSLRDSENQQLIS